MHFMQKLRNKKRLTALVLAFMLVFTVGAAFAFAPGVLDIDGRMHMASDYVVWYDVSDTAPSPLGIPVGATQSADITTRLLDTRTDQRIVWRVYFSEAGTAMLTATAFNNSNITVDIEEASYSWAFEGGFTAADFGLSVSINDILFAGALSALTESMPVEVTVTWTGDMPDLDDDDLDEVIGSVTGDTYLFAATLTVEFDYAPL